MVIPVLVVTPNIGLGELISQILNETGDYAVSLTTKSSTAIQTAEKVKPALVMVEAELKDMPAGELLASLRAAQPDVLVILIAPEGSPEEDAYAEMQPDGLLVKPVYLPDLVSNVDAVVDKSGLASLKRVEKKIKTARSPIGEKETDQQTPPAPAWLHDVNLAAQHLISLSLESSAQASLITKEDEIWAYAGELPRPAAEELARAVAVHFENGGGSDLARFIRLEETDGEYMLYATGLGGEYVLATVFSAETPFSKIRAQASQLADALASAPLPEDEEEIDPRLLSKQSGQDDGGLWPMLDDIPPPIPDGWVPETSLRQPENRESLLDELLEGATPDAFSSDTVAVTRKELDALPQNKVTVKEQQQGTKTVPEKVQPARQSMLRTDADETRGKLSPTVASETRAPKAARTRPSARGHEQPANTEGGSAESEKRTVASKSARPDREESILAGGQLSLDPVSPSMYSLTYACVLIPRFPNHYLSGEVAKRLSDWINHLTVAFGWRLEQLSIRPDYVQWMVNVPPNTSPGYLMRTIRQHTSRRMFIEFPSMEAENPSGDFWAPGYLILGNPQPPPHKLVLEFIHNTRKRQGLTS